MAILNKLKWATVGFLTGLLALSVWSMFLPGQLSEAINWLASRNPTPKVATFSESTAPSASSEMTVVGIQVSQLTYEPVIVLKEKYGERYLPIWIGLMEANSIGVAIEGLRMPRPLSHDLLYSVLNSTGAKVDSIAINDIKDGIYYAKLVLNIDGKRVEVDSRPSDAIAIAVRARASIYVEEKILDAVGLEAEQDSSPHYSF